MQNTENFNLKVYDGEDLFNPLTVENVNMNAIDTQMKKNENHAVGDATELVSGTVHAITRLTPDAPMLRFTATSRFTAGDTFTVDGVQVSALTVSGEQLPDGAYIIGSEVLAYLKGTLLTVFTSQGTLATAKNALKLGGNDPEYYATASAVQTAQETATAAGNLANEVNNSLSDVNSNLENVMHKADVLHDSSGAALQITSGYVQIVAKDIKQYRSLCFEVWNSGALGYRVSAEYSVETLVTHGVVATLSSDQDVSTPFKTGFICDASGISVYISGNPVHCRIFGIK